MKKYSDYSDAQLQAMFFQVFLTEWAWSEAEGGNLISLVDPALREAVELHRPSILAALQVSAVNRFCRQKKVYVLRFLLASM
jgi:hypothetical protein